MQISVEQKNAVSHSLLKFPTHFLGAGKLYLFIFVSSTNVARYVFVDFRTNTTLKTEKRNVYCV